MDNNTMELIKSAKQGNRYSIALLLQEAYAPLYKYCLKLTFDEHDAKDITQEAMAKAIEKISMFDPDKASINTWLVTIARNIWIDNMRRRKLLDKFFTKHISELSYDDSFEQIFENQQVFGAVNKLSPKLKAPIILKYSLDYSYEQIAKELQIPLGTVKSRISNALKIIGKEISEDGRQ